MPVTVQAFPRSSACYTTCSHVMLTFSHIRIKVSATWLKDNTIISHMVPPFELVVLPCFGDCTITRAYVSLLSRPFSHVRIINCVCIQVLGSTKQNTKKVQTTCTHTFAHRHITVTPTCLKDNKVKSLGNSQ